MKKCERCGKFEGKQEAFDYCANCHEDLCDECMEEGCCGKVPADSGHSDGEPFRKEMPPPVPSQ